MSKMILCELAVCFGPTLLYTVSGVVLLPQQLALLATGVPESVFGVLYFVCAACLFVGLYGLIGALRNPPRAVMRVAVVKKCLLIGIGAILLGPVGTFALMGFHDIDFLWLVVFLALPLICLAHLSYVARRYLFQSQPR